MLRPARAGRGGLRVGRRAGCRQKLGLGLSPLEDRWSNCLFFMIASGYQPPLANVATQPPRDAASVATAPERRSWMSASPLTSVRRQPPRTVRERPRPSARMATGLSSATPQSSDSPTKKMIQSVDASASQNSHRSCANRVAVAGSRPLARNAASAAPLLAWHHAHRSGAAAPTSTRRQGRRGR